MILTGYIPRSLIKSAYLKNKTDLKPEVNTNKDQNKTIQNIFAELAFTYKPRPPTNGSS